MSQPLSFLLLIRSIFFLNSLGTNSTSFTPVLCAPNQCGDVLISYPFSLHGDNITSDALYCGYRGFRLTCSPADGKLIFDLPNHTYYVKEIDYSEYTLTLVDIGAINQSCPRVRHDITLGTLPLNFSPSDLNLSFYFNCSSYPASVPHIGCLGGYNGNFQSFVFVEGEETTMGGSEWRNICEENVVATVTREIDHDIGNLSGGGFNGAMKNGFVLDWKPLEYCVACESSGGFCGYNNTGEDDRFLCFCEDGSISGERCKGKTTKNHKTATAVVEGGGAACRRSHAQVRGGHVPARKRAVRHREAQEHGGGACLRPELTEACRSGLEKAGSMSLSRSE